MTSLLIRAAGLFAILLAGCDSSYAPPRIDHEEREALFFKCLAAAPKQVASKESVVKDCDSWSWTMADMKAHDRRRKAKEVE